MRKNFRKTRPKDLFLAVKAFILAILIWFIFSITLYPTTVQTYNNVPLQKITVEGTIAKDYMLSPVSTDVSEIKVKILGKRYEIGDLSSNDLIAKVVIEDVNKPGEYDLNVKVTSKNNKKFEVQEVYPKTVKVTFDTLAEKTFMIDAQAPNISTTQEYIMEPAIARPSTVKISGPKQKVEAITNVVLKTTVKDTLTESFSTSDTKYILYNGDTVIKNTPFTFSEPSPSIDVPIYLQKELPLTFDFINVPKNFDLSSLPYTMDYNQITIAAPKSALENLSEIHIGYIDVNRIYNGSKFVLPLDLGDNYKNLSGYEDISIKFPLSNYKTKTISLKTDKLIPINTPNNYNTTIQTNTISQVKVIGPANIIDKISSKDFVGEIDLLDIDLKETTYNAPVNIYSPYYNNVWINGSHTVTIKISKKD